jgi:hypothetical protein
MLSEKDPSRLNRCAPFQSVLWKTLNVPYWETIVNGRERLWEEFRSFLEEVYKWGFFFCFAELWFKIFAEEI